MADDGGKARQSSGRTSAPPLLKIRHETLQRRVYDALRSAFLDGHFLPGQTLTLRALAEMTGTSVQPVREAVQRLCAENAIEWLPNTAFRVPDLPPDRYRELWMIRKLIEGRAAELAAQRITAEQVEELRKINTSMRATMRRGNEESTLRQNRKLHFAIYQASESPILVNMIETIWMQVSPLFAAYTKRELGRTDKQSDRLSDSAEMFFDLQEVLIDALARHRPGDALSALHHVLERSAELFAKPERILPSEPAPV